MIEEKLFQKRIEDFTCGHCGEHVVGNGYTNHCPKCLWSRHVDINPGDRQEDCGGLMEPIDMESKNGEFVIIHQCESCGFVRKNKVCKEDNFDEVIRISEK